MEQHRLRVATEGSMGHGTRVELDGVDISGVLSGFNLRVAVDDVNTAELFLFAPNTMVLGGYRVTLDEDTQALLKRLGWTPPSEEAP